MILNFGCPATVCAENKKCIFYFSMDCPSSHKIKLPVLIDVKYRISTRRQISTSTSSIEIMM